MTETKEYCDVCGSEIKADVYKLLLVKPGSLIAPFPSWEIDICKKCSDQITGTIGGEARKQSYLNILKACIAQLVASKLR